MEEDNFMATRAGAKHSFTNERDDLSYEISSNIAIKVCCSSKEPGPYPTYKKKLCSFGPNSEASRKIWKFLLPNSEGRTMVLSIFPSINDRPSNTCFSWPNFTLNVLHPQPPSSENEPSRGEVDKTRKVYIFFTFNAERNLYQRNEISKATVALKVAQVSLSYFKKNQEFKNQDSTTVFEDEISLFPRKNSLVFSCNHPGAHGDTTVTPRVYFDLLRHEPIELQTFYIIEPNTQTTSDEPAPPPNTPTEQENRPETSDTDARSTDV